MGWLPSSIISLSWGRSATRPAASVSSHAYEDLEEAYRKERAVHDRMRRLALRLGLVAAGLFVLPVVSVLVAWRLST